MGGERASTSRQRLAGKICCLCLTSLPPPHTPGERRCDRCTPRPHRIYMSFMLRVGWIVQFLEEDLKTPLPRTFTFHQAEKVIELARRGGASVALADRQAIDQAIENGRGGLWLQLTEAQYQKLKR